jgi:hypothetical protein
MSVAQAAVVGRVGIRGTFEATRGFRRYKRFLLDDALGRIMDASGGGVMPPVWALVAPANTGSHALFERHRFGVIGAAGHYDIRFLSHPGGSPPPASEDGRAPFMPDIARATSGSMTGELSLPSSHRPAGSVSACNRSSLENDDAASG